jgi:ABC-type multidrug transport system ATPase subunit
MLIYYSALKKTERIRRIDGLLEAFGLRGQENTIIGTPIQKGISGGQKRRTSVAAQLITAPKILFLDEPTSGLDSAASWEVMNYIKNVAKRNNLIVIASIHQPSTSTFQLFDKLLLLSSGRSHYFGTIEGLEAQFESMGYPIPLHTNPAEFLLELLNVDFASHQGSAQQRLQELQGAWAGSSKAYELAAYIQTTINRVEPLESTRPSTRTFIPLLLTLIHRSFIKSYRDVVAYGIRVAMYIGLAIMMGTVWLRLSPTQASIIPLTNAIVSIHLQV